MSASSARLTRCLRISVPASPSSSLGAERSSKLWFSTESFGGENKEEGKNEAEEEYADLLGYKSETESKPQGVNPGKGWEFRGVHRAIICGKVGQPPVQKLLRNGRNITIFTVGTGGMFDQRVIPEKGLPKPAQWHRIAVHNEALGAYALTERVIPEKGLPKPAQWHRIAVHNEALGAYAVQKIVKNSPVYVEGDIETRVYNDNINGEVKYIAEICVRRDGRIRLIKTGESISNISLNDLRPLLEFFRLDGQAHMPARPKLKFGLGLGQPEFGHHAGARRRVGAINRRPLEFFFEFFQPSPNCPNHPSARIAQKTVKTLTVGA
ncbi:Single-stranded DNA-binding protein [Morus notabilis]|uniref:Single-stranded DNA-binding protein n=1 Tax=Morus notabilis TaxID=981085 RepID=W9R5P5_9ROSA|nr:Single-stranded DNA-binding protein [Morus notabilis]